MRKRAAGLISPAFPLKLNLDATLVGWPHDALRGWIMPIPLNATEVLNREFLELRAQILQMAATLDRLDRAAGSVNDDPRSARIQKALAVLQSRDGNRAEQVQLIFSLAYEEGWQKALAPAKRM
jgi:hypothetical protein